MPANHVWLLKSMRFCRALQVSTAGLAALRAMPMLNIGHAVRLLKVIHQAHGVTWLFRNVLLQWFAGAVRLYSYHTAHPVGIGLVNPKSTTLPLLTSLKSVL